MKIEKMRLIKRSTANEYKAFSDKEAQYIAHQLVRSGDDGVYYMWNNESRGETGQYSTPFRTAICILKSLLSEIRSLKSQIRKYKEIEKERERQERMRKKLKEEERWAEDQRLLSNAYCGLRNRY